ncbi:MAG: hypothetical protein LH628_24885 [Microcoleus sp. CAN_BIN18]|nr:hypothetical protein [Microcoleus sp. CAN_BIN18]
MTPIAIDVVADRKIAFVPSLEYLYYPELVPQEMAPRCIHKSHHNLIEGGWGVACRKGIW